MHILLYLIVLRASTNFLSQIFNGGSANCLN